MRRSALPTPITASSSPRPCRHRKPSVCASLAAASDHAKPQRRRWRSLPTHLLQDKRAGTAVEFAFAAPVVLTMILGVIEFGWAFHCGASIRAAVTRESRQLIANPSMTAAQFQSAVRADLTGIADPNVSFAFSTETFGSGSAT